MADYISREAAIEAMYKDAEANSNHTFWTSQFEALMDIPAADVRPVRRGKWALQYDGDGQWHCSQCGRRYVYTTDFCPNCGAWMEES